MAKKILFKSLILIYIIFVTGLTFSYSQQKTANNDSVSGSEYDISSDSGSLTKNKNSTPFWNRTLLHVSSFVFLTILFFIFYQSTKNSKKKMKEDFDLRFEEYANDLSEATIKLEEKHEEIQQQKEELLQQSKVLQATNNELEEKNTKIEDQNEELEKYQNHLEELIKERTVELIDAKEKAEESDKLKSAFLANMSHEIRTPMNAIIGFGDLLSEAELEEEDKKSFIKLINKNSHTLLELINDIIDISKIEAEQIRIRKSDFEVAPLLKELYENFTINKVKDNVKILLEKRFVENRIIIYSDPLRLKQVLNNLLSNALKFTDKGTIEFGYDISLNSGGQRYVTFYVKDTGKGIPPEKKDVIFNRFHKIDDDKTRFFRGAGLGLSISKSLVELLDGEIWLESEEDLGSVFYFKLPLKHLVNGTKTEFVQKKITPSINKYDWEEKTILIAEDEENNYKFLVSSLKKTKAKILWAQNGKEVLEIFDKHKDVIDLILMDIKMPFIDGIEASKIIIQKKDTSKIIAQTAYSMLNEIEKIMAVGFVDFITKPIRVKDLLEMISKHI